MAGNQIPKSNKYQNLNQDYPQNAYPQANQGIVNTGPSQPQYTPQQYQDPAQSAYDPNYQNQGYNQPQFIPQQYQDPAHPAYDPNYQQPQYSPDQYQDPNYQNQGYNQPQNPYFSSGFENPNTLPPQAQPKKPYNNNVKKITDWVVKKWWLVAIIVVVLIGTVVGAALLFAAPEPQQAKLNYTNVKAGITAPTTLAQGTPGTWEVLIENAEPVPVTNVFVELKFDPVFQFSKEISPSPENPQGTQYKIARLDAAGGRSPSVKIRFEGILTGKPDIETIMTGNVSYTPEIGANRFGNLSSIAVRESRTKITSPEVDLTLVPTQDQVQNNGEAEYTATITNRTDREFRDLRVRMRYPDGVNAFTYTSSEYISSNTLAPKTSPDDGTDTWLVSRLAGGGVHTLKVRGKIFGANNAKLTFGVSVAVKASGNDYQVIRETFKDVTILAQPITLSTKIDGKDSFQIFAPDETLNFVVTYANDSQRTLTDVVLTSFIDDPANVLDLSTISFSGGERGDIAGNQVTWRATRVPQLQTLRPSQNGQLKFSVKVKPLATFLNPNLDQTKYTLRPGIQAKAQNLEQIEAAGILYKGKGALEFTQDVPVLKGKNPTTNNEIYTVTWRIRTWQNEVTDVSVRAISPLEPGSWLNKITPEANASSITYNTSSGEIIWSLGKVNSYTGRSASEITVSFDMEVSGSGRRTITREPQITGLDVFNGQKYDQKGALTETK
jgi:hypothetical protein